jgi:hypothetical protein
MIITLIGALSDNHLKLIQNNTVFPTQEKVDRVGFEPTTSAMPIFRNLNLNLESFSILMRPSFFGVETLLAKTYVTVILCFCFYD